MVVMLFLLPLTALACQGYVIGFKGLNESFDHNAFNEYARHQGYCTKSYSWTATKLAEQQIAKLTVPYQLYGFSKGAESVRTILQKQNLQKPEFVLTIGAYRTTDVNFDKYGVLYENYFDHSGRGQKSPGTYLNISHDRVQRAVNKIMKIEVWQSP